MMTVPEMLKRAAELMQQAMEALDEGDMERAEEMEAQAEEMKARAEKKKALQEKKKSWEQPVMPAPLPTDDGDGGTVAMPPEKPVSDEEQLAKSVTFLRYGDVDHVGSKAMMEIYGGDYRQIDYDQSQGFDQYLRTGQPAKSLYKMYWPIAKTRDMLKAGMSVSGIKSTMVEGIDVLGGYAVPPERGDMILQRTMGLTAVRQAGAIVVQTSSKMIEWLKITQGGDQYPSGMRGSYGSETDSPSNESNFDTGLLQIPVHIYTYKVPMSVSLLEDADNIVDIFTRNASETLAIDEDRDFLVGDGANRPRGILPGQANSDSLTEVTTGDADDVTMDGLKKLRRGIASQYRMNGRGSFVGNNQSGEDIELFQDGNGRYYFETVDAGEDFMGGRWFESEALPDPGASTYPLIYGDFSGYAIVERLGLTIQRYNDSNTGVNKVEFQIRRRIGGRVVEPWKFAVQKCST